MTISNGSDFDDFAGLEYHPAATRFRITHAGSFFGKRDPRPFLTALARVDGVVARFVGDFRSTDREWAAGIIDRIELIPYAPHRRALELQRDSEALLLLIPEADGRGRGVLSGQGVRVPRRRAADPRARPARRRRRGAAARDRRRRRRRARRHRRDRARADGDARPLARRRARRRRRSPTSGGRSVSRRTRVQELADLLQRSLEQRDMRQRHELLLPGDALLLHVREGALERSAGAVALADMLALCFLGAFAILIAAARAADDGDRCSASSRRFLLVYLVGFYNLETARRRCRSS